MSDFVDGFWSYYIASIALVGIIWCVWLLFSQRRWLKVRKESEVEDTGHVWDGDLRELNNPIPRWWTVMYVAFCVFGLGYLVLFPGLGGFQGLLQYSSAQEVDRDQTRHVESVRPLYAKFDDMTIPEIAKNAEAQRIGQRLFLNNCAQCHGSDAKGSPSFLNLIEGDSMYGRTPESIEQTITKGRHGVMPGFAGVIDAATQRDIANYVRSMSGLAHNQLAAIKGQRAYMVQCVACHGAEGQGNKALGAPNLTDGVWLYGSSEDRIAQAINNGLNNRMPAQEHLLTPEQIRMLTAWVWGLTHQQTEQLASTMSSQPSN
jgi:cytochrome c oxidase cbb3-type subunit III